MTGRPTPYDELFLNMVRDELSSARKLWPSTQDLVLAMAEEAGETVKSVLEHKHQGGDARAILKEAVQTAAMAVRLATEGDTSHPYDPCELFGGATDADYVRAFAQGGPAIRADQHAARLPDGSGLPDDHWLTANPGEPNIPPMPLRVGRNNLRLRLALIEKVSAAARYAVRCSTMNGASSDFDPDALVQNLVIGMLGYNTPDGVSDEGVDNPDSIPPHVDYIVFTTGGPLA